MSLVDQELEDMWIAPLVQDSDQQVCYKLAATAKLVSGLPWSQASMTVPGGVYACYCLHKRLQIDAHRMDFNSESDKTTTKNQWS
eukprot:5501394-Amphidinium_carterae.1